MLSDPIQRAIRTFAQTLVGLAAIAGGSALTGLGNPETIATVGAVLAIAAAVTSLVVNALEDNGFIEPRLKG